jgi:predicted nucleic acid-binding protein
LKQIEILPFGSARESRFNGPGSLATAIGRQDLRIAAITLVNQIAVLSRNLRDFQLVPGLAVEDWTV